MWFWAAAGALKEGDPASSLLPKSCMFSSTTRNLERFWPLCLSPEVSSWSRPSIKTGLPLPKCDFGLPAPERYIDKGRFLVFMAFLGPMAGDRLG